MRSAPIARVIGGCAALGKVENTTRVASLHHGTKLIWP
jgi:hypothetical protein